MSTLPGLADDAHVDELEDKINLANADKKEAAEELIDEQDVKDQDDLGDNEQAAPQDDNAH